MRMNLVLGSIYRDCFLMEKKKEIVVPFFFLKMARPSSLVNMRSSWPSSSKREALPHHWPG